MNPREGSPGQRVATSAAPWYGDGLRFECTQCGNCCTGAPGHVYVTEEEIERIAVFVATQGESNRSAEGAPGPWAALVSATGGRDDDRNRIAEVEGRELAGGYLRRIGRRWSLTERRDGDCCFLVHTREGRRICGIYPVRPLQCRTWPFWDSNLKTRADWSAAARDCPGMNLGPRHDLVQIRLRLKARRWEELPS